MHGISRAAEDAEQTAENFDHSALSQRSLWLCGYTEIEIENKEGPLDQPLTKIVNRRAAEDAEQTAENFESLCAFSALSVALRLY